MTRKKSALDRISAEMDAYKRRVDADAERAVHDRTLLALEAARLRLGAAKLTRGDVVAAMNDGFGRRYTTATIVAYIREASRK